MLTAEVLSTFVYIATSTAYSLHVPLQAPLCTPHTTLFIPVSTTAFRIQSIQLSRHQLPDCVPPLPDRPHPETEDEKHGLFSLLIR